MLQIKMLLQRNKDASHTCSTRQHRMSVQSAQCPTKGEIWSQSGLYNWEGVVAEHYDVELWPLGFRTSALLFSFYPIRHLGGIWSELLFILFNDRLRLLFTPHSFSCQLQKRERESSKSSIKKMTYFTSLKRLSSHHQT